MLLVVTGVTAILASCAVLLHSLLRLGEIGPSAPHLNDGRTVSRLAQQFREDVRIAEKADRTPGANQAARLTLTALGRPS